MSKSVPSQSLDDMCQERIRLRKSLKLDIGTTEVIVSSKQDVETRPTPTGAPPCQARLESKPYRIVFSRPFEGPVFHLSITLRDGLPYFTDSRDGKSVHTIALLMNQYGHYAGPDKLGQCVMEYITLRKDKYKDKPIPESKPKPIAATRADARAIDPIAPVTIYGELPYDRHPIHAMRSYANGEGI